MEWLIRTLVKSTYQIYIFYFIFQPKQMLWVLKTNYFVKTYSLFLNCSVTIISLTFFFLFFFVVFCCCFFVFVFVFFWGGGCIWQALFFVHYQAIFAQEETCFLFVFFSNVISGALRIKLAYGLNKLF